MNVDAEIKTTLTGLIESSAAVTRRVQINIESDPQLDIDEAADLVTPGGYPEENAPEDADVINVLFTSVVPDLTGDGERAAVPIYGTGGTWISQLAVHVRATDADARKHLTNLVLRVATAPENWPSGATSVTVEASGIVVDDEDGSDYEHQTIMTLQLITDSNPQE